MLDQLAIIESPRCAGHGGAEWPLTLHRAWARGAAELVLEFTDRAGRLVPGRWTRGDARPIRRRTRTEPGSSRSEDSIEIAGGSLTLLWDNHDPDLPGLADLLAHPGAALVSHRAGRRAVVRLGWDGAPAYGKALRPSRLAPVRWALEHVVRLDQTLLSVPAILHVDERKGIFVTRELRGVSLHDLRFGEPHDFVRAMGAAGAALRALHATAVPVRLPAHDAAAEADLLLAKLDCVAAFAPGLHADTAVAAVRVLRRLGEGECAPTLIHRDFYDKQVIVRDGEPAALLDLDTLATGEPALDIGNMLAHLELHEIQHRRGRELTADAAAAFLDAYAPDGQTARRIAAYRDSALLRLAMLYALWPAWAGLAPALLDALAPGRGHGAERHHRSDLVTAVGST